MTESMVTIPGYDVVRQLGEGSQGQLFEATAPERLGVAGKNVALKILFGAASEEEYGRVVDELAVVASLAGPHNFEVYEVGRVEGRIFYSMEYAPDGTLAAPSRPLTRAGVLIALACAARGAHALHEAGVAHRDIKPSNVIIHERGAKLADLGLAHLMAPGKTVTGFGPVESVEFMDPTLLRGGPATRASDLWSLGATLHWVLTGASLYAEIPRADVRAVLQHVTHSPPRILPSVSREDAAVIGRCLSPEPASRPRTADELALDLEKLAETAGTA